MISEEIPDEVGNENLMIAEAHAFAPLILNDKRDGSTVPGICLAFKGYRADGTDMDERKVGFIIPIFAIDDIMADMLEVKRQIEETF